MHRAFLDYNNTLLTKTVTSIFTSVYGTCSCEALVAFFSCRCIDTINCIWILHASAGTVTTESTVLAQRQANVAKDESSLIMRIAASMHLDRGI